VTFYLVSPVEKQMEMKTRLNDRSVFLVLRMIIFAQKIES